MTGPVSAESSSVLLVSTSRAADAGFLTLVDLAEITTTLNLDHRIVGGHMVTLLVALHGVSDQVPLRETADADFAALPTVIADPRLPAALVELGYTSRNAASALCLKALAYRGRFAAKDAVDLWRLLNAAYAAGLRVADWPGSVTGRQAAEILHRFFGAPQAAGLKQMSSSTTDRIRMQALLREVVPVP